MQVIDRLNPFPSTILSRVRLNGTPGDRETWHFVLSISGSGMEYQPGDSVAIYASNDPSDVDRILKAMHLDADALVKDAKGHEFCLREYLLKKVNIAHVPKKFLVRLSQEGADIQALLADEAALKHYTSSHTLVEIVEAHPQASWDPQTFVSLLQPMLPRFYSIASSQSVVPEEIHLTVARVQYMLEGRVRRGICSHFLCDLAPLEGPCVPLYLQSSKDFRVPVDGQKKMIMIGPGTGIAPFRAFMQERISRQATGGHWLFFGERHEYNDFFYGSYWKELEQQGHLRLDTAFSRDQSQKVYVQDRMLEHRSDLWQWLQEGALLYVCGNADKMAKDVDRCLHDIVVHEGRMSPEGAKEYLKQLRHEKRYLRDVY